MKIANTDHSIKEMCFFKDGKHFNMLVCEKSDLEEGIMLREDITTRATPWVDESTQIQHTRWD